PLRRLSGLSPSYADGILVCPTSAGAVVAVDLATRSLLWGYRYGQSAGSHHRGPFFAVQFGVAVQSQSPALRWVDANPMVVDGRVLVTPVESDLLHCLDLADGRPLWSAAREEDLYVACVHEGKVVLVGRDRVRALSLDDGEPAWDGRILEFPEGGIPSGHGLYTGNQYLLPLSSAEIVAIDLARGRTAHVARSRQKQVPGNLVAYKGFVLSQGARGLAAFHQIDALRDEVARRLAQDPTDAEALALRGELLLDEGERDEAIEHLARSHELAIDQRTVDLLRDALLDGLQNDFDAYLTRVDEIEPLLSRPREEAEFLRVMADGFQRAGRWSKAFEHYLKLVELDEESRRLEPVDKALSVRGDRWIRARLASLRADAQGDEAAEIERLIAARMRSAVDAGTVDALTRFLDYFGHDSSTDPAQDALVQSLINAGKLLEVELALWPDRTADETASGAAVARIAKLLDEAEQPAEAARAYRHLAERFGEVECGDGRTGRQLVEALPEERGAPLLAGPGSEWPQGRIDVQEIAANRPQTQGRFPLDFRGDPGPFFRDTIIRLDQTRRSISATDGQGRVRWTLPLVEPGSQHSFPFNPSTTYARACGHLLVISLGHRIVAIDALGQRGRGQVRILWSQDLTQGGFDQSILQLNPQGGVQLPQAFAAVAPHGQQSGSLGPVTPRRCARLHPVRRQRVCHGRLARKQRSSYSRRGGRFGGGQAAAPEPGAFRRYSGSAAARPAAPLRPNRHDDDRAEYRGFLRSPGRRAASDRPVRPLGAGVRVGADAHEGRQNGARGRRIDRAAWAGWAPETGPNGRRPRPF
ncbi:MAG: PQQ-binding-like beta-propeller repeat protein, partial [Thermoguttaceae bacterium]